MEVKQKVQFVAGLSTIILSILMVLVGFSVLMGCRRNDRLKAVGFFLLCLLLASGGMTLGMLFLNDLVDMVLVAIPIVVGVGLVVLYCGILRRRFIFLEAKWLRFLSYAVVMSVTAIIYMLIFHLLITYVFKVGELPAWIYVLNYLMVVILLLLFPIVNEVTDFINILIRQGQVDLTYVVKRLNMMAPVDVDLDELSRFLARQLHFDYVGLVVGGKLYGSKPLMVKKSELKPVTELGEPEYGIWQELDGRAEILCENLGVKAVAELRNAKGESFGQILIGEPLGKVGFERRDLIQVETIVNLVAAMIDTRATRMKR